MRIVAAVVLLLNFAAQADLRGMPLEEIVSKSDCTVEGTVEQIAFDKDRYRAELNAGKMVQPNMTVHLKLIESYPPISAETVTLTEGDYTHLWTGQRILVVLKKADTHYTPLWLNQVKDEASSSTVAVLIETTQTLPLDNAWQLIRSMYNIRERSRSGITTEFTEELIAKLKSDDLNQAALALRVLTSSQAKEQLTGDVLLDALETQYENLLKHDRIVQDNWGPIEQRIYPPVRVFRAFANLMMTALYPVADEASQDRLISLYIRDMSAKQARVFEQPEFRREMLRFALKPGAGRRERVLSLLGKEVKYYDKDGRQNGGTQLVYAGFPELSMIAETPGDDVEQILLDVLEHPDTYYTEHQQRPGALAELPIIRNKALSQKDAQ